MYGIIKAVYLENNVNSGSGFLDYSFNRKKTGEGYEFCSVKAEGFKTACASVNFVMPLSSKASLYALLPNILTRSSEKYPTVTELEKKLAMLYGAEITADVSKLGEHQVMRIGVSCIDDRFSFDGEKIVSECCELLYELIFNPLFKDGAFSADETESEKRMLSEQLGAEISDKRTYARLRCEEIMCADEPYGINRLGTKEDIDAITPKELTKAYHEMMSQAFVSVCVCANTDFESIEKIFADGFNSIERNVIESETLFVEEAEDVEYKKETEPVKQGKLVMGFRMGMTSPDDNYGARRVMTDLFGGSPNSKLFTVVREKMSLCYYCSASMVRQKGVMFVQSGIEGYNEEKTKKAVLDQLDAVKRGDFSDDDLDASVKALEDAFRSVGDSPESLDAWFMTQLTSAEYGYPEDFINMFRQVTREDIMAAANDVTLDTVFMLDGVAEGEAE